MTKVGSREFKNRLGHYLRRVARGERILVTDRGRPVAWVEAVQPAPDSGTELEARLRELAAQGHIRLARRKPVPFAPLPARGKPASRIIIEGRE